MFIDIRFEIHLTKCKRDDLTCSSEKFDFDFKVKKPEPKFQLAFRNIMTIITSLLLPRFRVQTWTLLSLVLLLISMAIAYVGQFVETENFIYLQVSKL